MKIFIWLVLVFSITACTTEFDIGENFPNPGIRVVVKMTNIQLHNSWYNFGDIVTNTHSRISQLTIVNSGVKELQIKSITLDNSNCFILGALNKTNLQPGETADLSVEFKPDVVAVENAVISINNNTKNSPQYRLLVTGTGRGNGSLTYVGGVNTLGSDSPHYISITPDGKFAYVAGFNVDNISWYSRDANTGELAYINQFTTNTMDGTRAVIVSSDNKNVNAAYIGSSSIGAFSRNQSDGSLTLLTNYVNVSLLNNGSLICLTPDGQHIYRVSRDSHRVIWFDRLY